MNAAERVDEIQARVDKATDGPWEKDERWCQINQRESGAEVVVCFDDADSEFIAHARTDVPWLIEQVRKRDAALRAILDLHEPVSEEGFDVCVRCSGDARAGAIVLWPCPTVCAGEAALGEAAP